MMRWWLRLTNADARLALRGNHASYWSRRRTVEQLRFRLLRGRFNRAAEVQESRASLQLLRELLRRILPALALAVVLIAFCEVVAMPSALPDAPPRLQPALAALSPSAYGAFVNTAAQVGGTLLALYFATVGVVASTAYAQAPHRLRILFVREKAGRFYTRCVALLVTSSLLVVALDQLDVTIHSSTILLLIALAVFSVLSLVELGVTIFNFFDPSSLAQPLVDDFRRWSRAASRRDRFASDESFQAHFQTRAAQALTSLRELLDFVLGSTRVDQERVAALGTIASGLVSVNVTTKTAVPTASLWYPRKYRQPSWLAAPDSHRSMAIATMTALQVAEIPDHQWVESRLSEMLRRAVSGLISAGQRATAMGVLNNLANSMRIIGAQLQAQQGLDICRSVLSPVWEEASRSDVDALERAGLVDAAILNYISLGLGVHDRVESMSAPSVRDQIERAFRQQQGIYSLGIPVQLLQKLEELDEGLRFEREVEDRQITPSWFTLQIVARNLLAIIRDEVDALVTELHTIVGRTRDLVDAGESVVAAAAAYRALELCNKTTAQAVDHRSLMEQLQTLRRVPDEFWPKSIPPGWPEQVTQVERDLVELVAKLLLSLAALPRTDSDPDWFGRAYSLVVWQIFAAMEKGDEESFAKIFPYFFAAAFAAKDRLSSEVAGWHTDAIIAFLSEPLTDMLELSGYALLFSELDARNFWAVCSRYWDALLAPGGNPQVAEVFAIALRARQSIFALKPRDMERANRKRRFEALLRDRGIVDRRTEFLSGRGSAHEPVHPSPIIQVFAPADLGGFANPEDLFVIEYLKKQPQWSGDLPRSTLALEDQLTRTRERRD